MGKKRNILVKLTPHLKRRVPKGHAYGKGRPAKVMKHKNARRAKDKKRRELEEDLW
jgi:hypothetical protein